MYVTAQERIQSLENDQETLQSLYNRIQGMRVEMVRAALQIHEQFVLKLVALKTNVILLQCSVKSSAEDAIFTMKEIGDMVNVDQETLSKQVC